MSTFFGHRCRVVLGWLWPNGSVSLIQECMVIFLVRNVDSPSNIRLVWKNISSPAESTNQILRVPIALTSVDGLFNYKLISVAIRRAETYTSVRYVFTWLKMSSPIVCILWGSTPHYRFTWIKFLATKENNVANWYHAVKWSILVSFH